MIRYSVLALTASMMLMGCARHEVYQQPTAVQPTYVVDLTVDIGKCTRLLKDDPASFETMDYVRHNSYCQGVAELYAWAYLNHMREP